jgi:outer membrane protein TolC
VNAYENVIVQQRALDLANKTLSDNQKQVAAGTLAPMTVVQSQSAVATAKQNMVGAQVALQLQQLLMKNAITRNMADPILAVAPVIPTDTLDLDAQYEVRPVEDLVRAALERRPEIAQSRIDLRNREISRKSVRNLMFPSVDVYAFYGASALAGDQNALSTEGIGPNCRGGSTSGFSQCYPPGFWPFPPNGTSYSSAFKNLFNSSFPDKGVGVNISIPLRNRQAQADQVRSELEYRQAQMALQQQENTITLQVRQAQFAVQQNYAALQAALAAQEYAQQRLVAEQTRFSLGASTTTLVLQMSSNLATAESNTLAAASNYQKSKVQLDLYTAATLTKLGIDIGDAEAGKVQRVPHVPGIVPQQNDQQGIPQQLQQQQQNPSAPPSQANPPQTTTPPQQ